MVWRSISIASFAHAYYRPNHGFIVRTVANLSFKFLGDTILYPDDPPIVIIHGLLESKKNWEGVGKTIQNMTKRAVVAMDLRNHGDSQHLNSHKYEDMAEDIQVTLKKLGIERVCLLGHSVGGRACMCVALTTPRLVSSLVVIDISPVSSCSQFLNDYPKILAAMKAINFDKLSKKVVRQAKADAHKQLMSVLPNDVARYHIVSNIKVKRDGTIGWSCNLDVLIKQFEYIAHFPKSMMHRKYEGPTLFVGGQLSDFIPPDDLSGIRDIFPRSLVRYVNGARHNVHVDDPHSFLEMVISFIKDN